MASKRKLRMTVHNWDGFSVMDLGNVEIWDGADLALLRETQTRLVDRDNCRALGVNMQYVKYIPSGFFGMLFDLHERGVQIRLYAPQPHVKNMLWFRQFFDHVIDETFKLCSEARQELVPPADEVEWDEEAGWDQVPVEQPVSAITRD